MQNQCDTMFVLNLLNDQQNRPNGKDEKTDATLIIDQDISVSFQTIISATVTKKIQV